MVAQNDSTTASVTTLAKILQEAGRPHRLRIYPPYYPPQNPGIALGHLIFLSEGMPLWQSDVVAFL
jgi:hypothetical protein